MKKLAIVLSLFTLISGCSVLSELTAFTKCEFRYDSFQDARLCGIDVSNKSSLSDFSFSEGNRIASSLIQKKLPFYMTINVEVRNPGANTASVSSMEWIALIEDMEVARGQVDQTIEVAANGGSSMIPVQVGADLVDYLEGDNPSTMLDFALNLMGAGNGSTRVFLKIKPSVKAGNKQIQYPGYFTISEEFTSGN